MFAPVDGKPRLVGAAYAYLHPTRAALPEGFDGRADHWHTHDDLTNVPGKHLVMTHVWFVDAPGGPFARYNPWLPFLGAGLATPPASALHDAASARRVRELALALTLVTQPPRAIEQVERLVGLDLATRLRTHRDGIRALLPQLRAAQRTRDVARYERLAVEAVGHSNAMLSAYRASAGSGWMRGALDGAIAEFFAGEHAHHGG